MTPVPTRSIIVEAQTEPIPIFNARLSSLHVDFFKVLENWKTSRDVVRCAPKNPPPKKVSVASKLCATSSFVSLAPWDYVIRLGLSIRSSFGVLHELHEREKGKREGIELC